MTLPLDESEEVKLPWAKQPSQEILRLRARLAEIRLAIVEVDKLSKQNLEIEPKACEHDNLKVTIAAFETVIRPLLKAASA